MNSLRKQKLSLFLLFLFSWYVPPQRFRVCLQLSAKINTFHQTLLQIKDKVTAYDLHFPWLPGDGAASIPVVMNNSGDWQCCGRRLLRFGPNSLTWIGCKVSGGKFFGIAKAIGDLFHLSLFKNCSGVAKATRIGNFWIVKTAFSDQGSRISAPRLGLRIEYELIPIYEFKKIPRCCNKCQSPEHLIVNCPTTWYKCATCYGPQEYCKDTPCTDPINVQTVLMIMWHLVFVVLVSRRGQTAFCELFTKESWSRCV